MKVRVIKDFIDKNTKQLQKTGKVIDVTDARLSDFRKAGNFVEPVQEDNEQVEPGEQVQENPEKLKRNSRRK